MASTPAPPATIAAHMTAPAQTIEINTPAYRAATLMRTHQIRHLPVVERGRIVGMLSERDLLPLCKPVGELMAGEPLDVQVGGLVSREPVTVGIDDTLGLAVDRMLRHGVGALPVVNPESGAVLGVLSYVDVLRALRGYL